MNTASHQHQTSDDVQIEQIIAELLRLFEEKGQEHFGEWIGQLAHGLQAAALAEKENAPEDIVLGALLHDIGFLAGTEDMPQMEELGTKEHEIVGAEYLKFLGFGPKVCSLVRQHVNSKRYLCTTNPMYFNRLSDAGRRTLEYQGGKMKASEVDAFERDPLFDWHLRMRMWDDTAKDPDIQVPGMFHYLPMVRRHLRQHLRNRA